ncbi:unnamed protein product [Prorocentrum cordatum]|uniref:Uncharacterized protein n=1 Tax=Prorocentrum cordatum TaxID=2364126 RepID=A0ABN9WQV7_9DINO|nr:unnamed protein product [Polarella glacialis]
MAGGGAGVEDLPPDLLKPSGVPPADAFEQLLRWSGTSGEAIAALSEELGGLRCVRDVVLMPPGRWLDGLQAARVRRAGEPGGLAGVRPLGGDERRALLRLRRGARVSVVTAHQTTPRRAPSPPALAPAPASAPVSAHAPDAPRARS